MGRLKTWITCCLCLMIVLPFLASPASAQEAKPKRSHRCCRFVTPGYGKTGGGLLVSWRPGADEPVDTLLPPDSWVSIDEEVEQDGRLWYRVADQAYVLADDVQPGTPRPFTASPSPSN